MWQTSFVHSFNFFSSTYTRVGLCRATAISPYEKAHHHPSSLCSSQDEICVTEGARASLQRWCVRGRGCTISIQCVRWIRRFSRFSLTFIQILDTRAWSNFNVKNRWKEKSKTILENVEQLFFFLISVSLGNYTKHLSHL